MSAGSSTREKRILLIGAPVILLILVWRFGLSHANAPVEAAVGESVPQAERRLAKLRQVAATVPGKQAVLQQVDAEMATREKGILLADTAPQAQARLLEIIHKVAAAEGIEFHGGDFAQPKLFGSDYGEVSALVMFNCPIEKFVNFLSGLSHEPELIGPSEVRVSSQNPKEKTVTVRMTVGGLVVKKLVPEKKGFVF